MIVSEKLAKDIASQLINIGAVEINLADPFVWSSGWKSPIYCDNRKTLGHPEVRTNIKKGFLEAVGRFNEPDIIVGVATGGIAHGVLVAQDLDLPFAYVRSKPKKHGLNQQIEGDIPKGSKALVIEDLFSTGRSSCEAILALQFADVKVVGCASIFNYGFPAVRSNFDAVDTPYVSLSSYDILIQNAIDKGEISEELHEKLMSWKNDPASWTGIPVS